jgi:uncharacterized protein (TIGR00251 family)
MADRLIKVKVSAGSRMEKVEVLADGSCKVWVRQVAEKGKANACVLKLLAEHFGVAKSGVEVVKGATSRDKLIRVG